MIRLVAGQATDPGRVRTTNQDRIGIVDGVLYAVADGMGGHRGGEVAAEIVAEGLKETANDHKSRDAEGMPLLKAPIISERIVALNQSVLDRAADDDDLYGMGTTLTALALTTAQTRKGATELVVSVFNIGDSRTYLLRNGEFQQLTEDHSVVADLIRAGTITPEEARTHRQRSVVTRALGVEPTIELDVLDVLPSPGMRFLLCSDGLSGEVPDEQIGSLLRRLADPTEAAKELVRLANEKGGRDNVSVVVVDVLDDTGSDQTAILASAGVTATAKASSQKNLRMRTISPGNNSGGSSANGGSASGSAVGDVGRANDSRSTTRVATSPDSNSPTTKPKKVRKPLPINLRVIAFLGVLAALAGAVIIVLKNQPDPDPTETSIVDSVPLSTLATPPTLVNGLSQSSEPGSTTTPTTIPAPTTSGTVPIGGFNAAVESVPSSAPATPGNANGADSANGAVTSTTLDDFAPTPATKKKVTKAKRKRGKVTKQRRRTKARAADRAVNHAAAKLLAR